MGKRKIKMLLKTLSGRFVSGTITGNELSGASMAPMLLSDPAQATLGVNKDSRTGLCLIRPEGEAFAEPVELFRFKGTGLIGVCISGD